MDDQYTAAYKAGILMDLGEPDNGPVALNIDTLWLLALRRNPGTDIETISLMVKIKAIDKIIGSVWRGNLTSVGNIQIDKLDDKVNFLRQMKADTEDELNSIFTLGRLELDFLEPGDPALGGY